MSTSIILPCACITFLFSAFAADDGGPLNTRGTRPQTGAANIRADVNMALVPVSVTDTWGHSVRGLGRDNFQVFEGSRQMPIAAFSTEDQRVTVGLIFDCSASMTEKFKTSRMAPVELFQQLNPDDESFLVTVSDKAELRWPLTSNFEDLQNALLFVHPQGTTSLLDGVYLGLQQIRKSSNQRKALVIVSDGGDNDSRYSLRDLKRQLVESDVQIFAAGFYQNPRTHEEESGPALLSALCDRSGGANFEVKDQSALRAAMGRIGVALHNQYVIGYYPPDSGTNDGKFRKIKVQLVMPRGAPELLIHARAGYYSPKQ